MKLKKIRGHNRRQKQIDHWRVDNLSLDLIDYLLNHRDRYYTKISVHPWSGLSLTNSVTPQPTGKTKQEMLNGLLDIYENWKTQLDEFGQAYYLKIWLFEPRFSQSQVVCAIGDSIDFYENTFYKPELEKAIQLANYGALKTRLSKLSWDYRLDEDHYDNTEVGNRLTKPHRAQKFKETIGNTTESYSFKRGNIWLGEQK